MKLTIAITSDFICPWCLVVEKRLSRAISLVHPAVEVDRLWLPFELNPQMLETGMDRKIYRTQKFGSWEYSQMLDSKTVQATQADDINFRYNLMRVTPNTRKAHRLTWWAGKQGKATQMAERILVAYFTEGQDIGNVEILSNLAAEIGIDATQAKVFLNSDEGIQEIADLEQQAIAQGIHSVPTVRIGREIISGAQLMEVFVAALQKAVEDLEEN